MQHAPWGTANQCGMRSFERKMGCVIIDPRKSMSHDVDTKQETLGLNCEIGSSTSLQIRTG